jgi:nitrogen fixation NifU-like protein
MYTPKVISHFRNPRHYGKMENPDGVGKVGNVVCGDVMWLYLKIGKNTKKEEIIKDIKFETFGCVAAIATSSIITDLAKRKTLRKAMMINKDKIITSLGGLPPVKVHCSVLASDALFEAIYDYLSKNKKKIPPELEKKHQRLQKEKELVETKYKDWVGAEEAMRGTR